MIFQALMAAHGIEASGSGVIERCVVSGYVDQAIKIHGEGLRFDRNLVGLSIGGVWVSGSRASITRNVVRAEHTLDLYDDDNLVERNTLSVLSFTGLLVFGHRNHILNNHIQYSASAGLAVRGNDNVLLGNTLQNTRLVLYGSANTYGGNVAWWDPGAMPPPFATPCPGGFSTKNFCEIGAGNVSKGNNYLPDRM
jgi:hypothetical protein